VVQTNPFTIENIAPCTYFVVSGLVYLSIVMYMFYSKRKVKTVENFCYSVALWLTISAAVEDLLRLILPIWIKSDLLFNILNKLHIMLIIFILCVLSAYTLALTSKKYQGRIDFNQNKYKTYFKKWLYVFLGIGFVISTVFFFIKSDVGRHTYLFAGERIYTYLLIVIGAFIGLWAILMLKNFNKDARKRYAPLIGLILLLFVGSSCNRIFEYMLPSTFSGLYGIVASIIFAEIFMYFSMENPDIIVINELNEAKEKASEANSDKTKFLSTMSHEIRTPLNAIVGLSQALKEEEGISENAKEELNDIIMSSESLIEIVNGILDISKIEEDVIEITPIEYSFNKLTDEVIALSKSRLDTSGKPIEFHSYVDKKIPPVLYGDSGKIKEIIVNFLTNAIKYTDKGQINFNVTGELKGDVCTIRFSVSDTGIGIKEEDIGKLFTRFQRFDLDKNNSVEGTGLGLSITKKMVELMAGKVDVQSEYGKGSTFSVIVDQKIINKSSLDEGINSSQPFDASGQTIVVVDDNEINLKVARKELSKYKVNIVEFLNHDEFIKSVKEENNYNLILLDDGLPEESTLIKELRAIPEFRIPVVAYTANAISGIRDKYLEVGYNEYLSKPVDRKELRRVLKLFLNAKVSEEEIGMAPPVAFNAQKRVGQTYAAPVVTTQPVTEPPKEVETSAPVVEQKPVEVQQPVEVPIEAPAGHTKEYLEANNCNVSKALESLGDMETFDIAAEEFVAEFENNMNKIKTAKEAGDMPNYAIETHGLKSNARYLGFEKLGDMAYEHEMAGKENKTDFVNTNYDKLIEEANIVNEVLKKYMSN